MENTKKYLPSSIAIVFMVIGTFFFMYQDTLLQKGKLVTATSPKVKAEKVKAEKATAISYEGAMIISDLKSIEDIMSELDSEPTAAGDTFDLATMAISITAEALKSFSDSKEYALPLVSHWNLGIPEYTEAMDPMYMIGRIEFGEHILVSWKLDPYYNDSISSAYYEESVKKAAELQLPLVFVLPAPESALTKDAFYRSLDKEENPNVINANGEVVLKLSPFGLDSTWNEVGEQWSSTSLMAQLQEWYPNPPLVIFVSEDEADKLLWSEVDLSIRYTTSVTEEKDDNFKRTLVGAQWIEKYRQMHEGFKQGFTQNAWKENVKFITHNKLSDNVGLTNSWIDDATLTNNYMNIWPLTADGVTVDFDLTGTKSDQTADAPHILANNLPFMLDEAKAVNPNFSYQLNLNANAKIDDPARYRGLTQFALWFLRPSTIRQASEQTERAELEVMFQEVADSVELIHYNEILADFWKNGELVNSGVSDLNQNIPEQYANDPRWFLLDVDKNPTRPWADDVEIPVWAFALVKGEAPNREWLIYVQSPDESIENITLTIPRHEDVLVTSSTNGNFYVIGELNTQVDAIKQTTTTTTIVNDINTTINTVFATIVDEEPPIITHGNSTTYYLDSTNGLDTNDGLTESTAWKTLTKINNQTYQGGTNILLKRGEVFKTEVGIRLNGSGSVDNRVLYSAYGDGPKPIISILKDFSHSWTYTDSNIWIADESISIDRLKQDGAEILRANTISELDAQFRWYNDKENDKLYLYSVDNPDSSIFTYNAVYADTITISSKSYSTIDQLEIIGGLRTLAIYFSDNIMINNCKLGEMSSVASIYFSSSNNSTAQHNDVNAEFNLDYFNITDTTYSTARGPADAIIINNSDNIETKYNTVTNWCHASIICMGTSGYAKIHHNIATSPDIPYGGRISSSVTNHHLEVYNNYIYDNGAPVQLIGNNNHVHHNIIMKMRNAMIKVNATGIGIVLYSDSYNNVIEDNTIIDTQGNGLYISYDNSGAPHDNIFRNNIFYNTSTHDYFDQYSKVFRIHSSDQLHTNSYISNIIYNDSLDPTISYRYTDYTVDGFNELTDLNNSYSDIMYLNKISDILTK